MPQSPPRTSSLRFILGTRGSRLALAQADETRRRLSEAHGWEADRIEFRIIRTSGDTIQDRPLAESGGKGLFTKEIDAALLNGEIDGAVHSAKDLPTLLPEGVALAGFLPREDVRDALISSFADTIEGLPRGASLGAASLRRQAQALRLRPDLRPQLLRGNVETRLSKAESGAVGATLLAMAGLKRLGLVHRARSPLEVDHFLPAVGQGAIALTARSDDPRALAALAAIADAETLSALTAERAFLAELEGSCRTPIAGLARLDAGRLRFRGQVLRTDGSESFEIEQEGPASEAARIGAEAGRGLAAKLPPGILPRGK
ncbi:MAG TPA: hydroxymethylbilane synthase [Roseiarcus sp.]|nr:hydroxymethylbilane synthase [Roseiarcus sp.]